MFKMEHSNTVFVVDDDLMTRESIGSMVRLMGLQAGTFQTGEEFLEANVHHQPGCVVADLRMPGMNGIALLERIRLDGAQIPLILITAYADVATTVEALRRGAMTVLEKPYRSQVLWDHIVKALKHDQEQRAIETRRATMIERIASLTPEEIQILQMMVKDVANKVIATRLQISLRTVDHRRAEIMTKLRMTNMRSLIWYLGAAGWPGASLSSPNLEACP